MFRFRWVLRITLTITLTILFSISFLEQFNDIGKFINNKSITKYNVLTLLVNYDLTKYYNFTSLSRPTNNIVRKNNTDQSGDNGIWVTAFGYARNTKPGPANIVKNTINEDWNILFPNMQMFYWNHLVEILMIKRSKCLKCNGMVWEWKWYDFWK